MPERNVYPRNLAGAQKRWRRLLGRSRTVGGNAVIREVIREQVAESIAVKKAVLADEKLIGQIEQLAAVCVACLQSEQGHLRRQWW